MARKLVPLVLVLLALLAFWIWRENGPSAVPLAAPTSQPAHEEVAVGEPTATPPAQRQDETVPPATATATLLVVICRAKETGAPLSGQNVQVSVLNPPNGVVPVGTGTHGRLNEKLTTGSDGRVEYELPAGVPTRLSSYPEKRGANATARREIEPLAAGEQREIVVELATQEDAHFFARVLSRETHTPIAGAEIQGGPRPLATDADGRFDLPYSSWSMQRLSVLALGYAETVVMAQPGHETPEKALVIELERSCTLVGLLQGAGDAATRGRLRMVVTTEGYRLTTQDPSDLGAVQAEYDHTWRAEFDSTGRAEIAGLVPNAPLRVSIFAGATRLVELADPIKIAPGATREVELKAADTCRLTGVVRDDGGAVVPEVTLWLLRAGNSPRLHLESYERDDRIGEAKTDAQGRFTFPKVSPGTWRLGPEAKMYRDGAPIPADAVAPIAILVEIPAGEQEHTVELVVHRGLTITGSVLDPDGKGVNNAGVGAFSNGNWTGTSCGADGGFVLGPLAPGSYTLDASPSFHKELARSENVQADAGTRDVVLRLRPGGTLSGRVVDAATGEGVASTIAVSQPGNKTEYIYMPRSKADGSFELGGLLPGTYALAATLPDGRAGILRGVDMAVGSKASGLVISVRAGARLRVRYAGEQKFASLSIEQDGVYCSGDGVEKGTSQLFTAPAGAVRVVCRLRGIGKELVRELTLKAGEEQELVFKDED
jgi:hypothetical protein